MNVITNITFKDLMIVYIYIYGMFPWFNNVWFNKTSGVENGCLSLKIKGLTCTQAPQD